MRRLVITTLFILTAVPTFAFANRAANDLNNTTPNCKNESVTVQTQHTLRADSAETLLKNYETEKASIQELAKKAGVIATVKSENYNINSQNDGQYRGNTQFFALDGNASYNVEPKDKAKNFFLLLTNNKLRGNLSYNMNNNCGS